MKVAERRTIKFSLTKANMINTVFIQWGFDTVCQMSLLLFKEVVGNQRGFKLSLIISLLGGLCK